MALIQITAYVRNEDDLAKWKALGNKTEWLHKHLDNLELDKERKAMNEAVWPQPPKCDICGNYHFGGDLQAIKQWHEPTSEPMEEAA